MGADVTCGLRAAYGAVVAAGLTPQCSFESLLNDNYVGSLAGSSDEEVIAAVQTLGGYARRVDGGGALFLRSSTSPLILHVCSEGQLSQPNHWLLFLGCERSQAIVVDTNGEAFRMRLDALLLRWRGTAVVVTADEPFSLLDSIPLPMTRLAFFACSLAVPALFLQRFSGVREPTRRAALMSVGLSTAWVIAFAFFIQGSVAPITATALTNYSLATDGLLNPIECDLDSVQRASRQGDAALVDCRYSRDFAYGTIPGSLNLPIDADFEEFRRIVASLSRTRPIIVFCQSTGCRFSDVVSVRLREHGFEDIKLYRKGYVGFQVASEQKARRSEGKAFK